jgi:uncharacterized RDD family membrane protein YckC
MNNTGLFCTNCGDLNDTQARFCRRCGAPQPQSDISAGTAAGAVAPARAQYSAPEPPPYPLVPTTDGSTPPGWPPAPVGAAGIFRGYAGFWIRFLAVLIDGAALSIVMVPLVVVFAGLLGAVSHTAVRTGRAADPAAMLAMLPIIGAIALIAAGINWLYEALLTSSSKQGTLGKMALGLKVTDKNGNRLTFMHATGRHFAKLINGFTMNIGYIMVGFTERKQGLHDMIAETYVIKT